MSRIKSSNTRPEIVLRKFLYRSGFRYRIRNKLAGKPDLIFPKNKIAIFIHGCFWHRHGCRNSVIPKTNREFWLKKLEGNINRDKKVLGYLKNEKWKVKIIWECQLEDGFEHISKKLVNFLNKNGVRKIQT